jgi:hypothetical protein
VAPFAGADRAGGGRPTASAQAVYRAKRPGTEAGRYAAARIAKLTAVKHLVLCGTCLRSGSLEKAPTLARLYIRTGHWLCQLISRRRRLRTAFSPASRASSGEAPCARAFCSAARRACSILACRQRLTLAYTPMPFSISPFPDGLRQSPALARCRRQPSALPRQIPRGVHFSASVRNVRTPTQSGRPRVISTAA